MTQQRKFSKLYNRDMNPLCFVILIIFISFIWKNKKNIIFSNFQKNNYIFFIVIWTNYNIKISLIKTELSNHIWLSYSILQSKNLSWKFYRFLSLKIYVVCRVRRIEHVKILRKQSAHYRAKYAMESNKIVTISHAKVTRRKCSFVISAFPDIFPSGTFHISRFGGEIR